MSYTVRPLRDTDTTYTPVTFETPYSLTGCTLDDGRGLLVWVNGTSVRTAILTTPSDWLTNSIVTAADSTITPSGSVQARYSSCWTAGGLPYILVGWQNGATGYNDIYEGDAGATTWTYKSTVQSSGLIGSYVQSEDGKNTAGIPYINGSRWVLPCARWNSSISSHFHRAGVYLSTNAGSTWSEVLNLGFHINGGAYVQFMSAHVGREPATGDLYWHTKGTSSTGGQEGLWLRSTDDGSSWSLLTTTTATAVPNLVPYTAYSGKLYALEAGTETVSLDDPATSTDTTPYSSHVAVAPNAHICIGGRTPYLFSNTTVQWAPQGGPTTGFIGFGTF